MNGRVAWTFLSIGLMLTLVSRAQPNDSQCIKLLPGTMSYALDSVFIAYETINFQPPVAYQLDTTKQLLQFDQAIRDTTFLCYQKFPIQVGDQYYRRSRELYFDDEVSYQTFTKESTEPSTLTKETLFPTDNLDKMGAISRSVSFGNTQDVFVNSTLNLQLQGQLTDDINIEAVIADQNVPFQPEGNTQQLRDFDNVYIKLFNDRFNFTAGDVVLQNQESYFLRYYKNVQGGEFNVDYDIGKSKASTNVAASVAKGQFASIFIDPIEGVLGPYRVRGPNGERFVIIMANSEKVFIDGKRVERGFDRDYIIDYNQGEITFNPGVLITKFTRIRVDFEYADQNYSRTIIAGSHQQQFDKLTVTSTLYRERDNANQPLAFTLSNEDKRIMAAAGDDISFAQIDGADSVSFSEERILYMRKDTVVNDESFSIYEFSSNPDEAFYTVTFSEVGENNGDYILQNNGLNGRTFSFIAPVNGIPQGNFSPVIQVPTPNQRQLWNNELVFEIDSFQRVFTDVAISNYDQNLYAENNGNNTGWAVRGGYAIDQKPIGTSAYRFSGGLSFEHNDTHFQAIDRFRYIEFDRDWSYRTADSINQLNENIWVANFAIHKDQENQLTYQVSTRSKADYFQGVQQNFSLNKRLGVVRHASEAFLLDSEQGSQQSNWRRWKADTYLDIGKFIPGYIYQVDRNKVFEVANDSIVFTAMNFSEHQFYIKTHDTLKHQLRIDYAMRVDDAPVEGRMAQQNRAQTASLKGGGRLGNRQNIQYALTYRNLEDLLNPDNPDEETVMGRIDWSASFWKGNISHNLTYALGNSRELRREFVFIRVNNGQGTHTWRDDNADGVQDLNEFYLAINPDEKNYVKIFVPTDEYVIAYNNILNYRLSVNTPLSWRNESGLKKLLGSLSNITSINRDRKLTAEDLNSRYNPFARGIVDEELIALRDNIRSTLFINRGSPRFGLELGWQDQASRQLLTGGLELRERDGWNYKARYNIQRQLTFQLGYEHGNRLSFSDVQTNRNWSIRYANLSQEVIWQPNNHFRLSGTYALRDNENLAAEGEGESSLIQEVSTELRWAKAIERSVTFNFRLASIDFEGVENTPIGYELLEALRPGTNYLWNLQWQQRLLNGLQLNLGYEGRKSPDQNTVHIGRVQVTALF